MGWCFKILAVMLGFAALAGVAVPCARADLLVISGTTSNSILRYDQTTGAFVDVFVPPLTGGQVSDPQGMTFGPDGNLYTSRRVATIGEPGGVTRYDGTTGAFIDNFVPAGSGGLVQPGTIAFGPDGNIYVRSGSGPGLPNHSILRYDGSSGAFLGVFVPPVGSAIRDFVFGPDGNLYATADGDNVFRYNGTTGAFLGSFAGGFGGDFRGLAFGPDGDLYVADDAFSNSTIRRFDGTTGAFLGNFVGPGSGGLFNPDDILFGPDGNLYVSNTGTNSVLRYDWTTGAFLGEFVAAGSGGLVNPTGLLFTPTVIPEPGTLALFGIGVAGLIGYGWQRRRCEVTTTANAA